VLDTLAAAYAEAGEYDQALDAANRALNLAAANGDSAKASAIRYRIGLYTDGKPYRQ
jgi:tetratricopeptide (TPR) repeat protein